MGVTIRSRLTSKEEKFSYNDEVGFDGGLVYLAKEVADVLRLRFNRSAVRSDQGPKARKTGLLLAGPWLFLVQARPGLHKPVPVPVPIKVVSG